MKNFNVKQIDKLKRILGEEAFQELVGEMPGAAIRLPNNHEYFDKQSRNEKIREDYDAGMAIHELMNLYQLSRSQIYRIVETR